MSIHPYDASIITMIMRDGPINGQIREMSDDFKPIAEKLIETQARDRPKVLEALLVDRFGDGPQVDAIIVKLLDHDETTAIPEPPAAEAKVNQPAIHRGFISNGTRSDEDRQSLSVQEIDGLRVEMIGDWPKRVDEKLFVVDGERVVYLNTPSRLFARFDVAGQVDWHRGGRFITQERYHEHLKMTAERYDAVETLPHWPPIKSTYYVPRDIPRNGNGMLDRALDFFSPATDLDRLLIKSYVVTLFWGGEAGQRPAFLVEGEDGDPKKGRGIGKTTIANVLGAELAGGVFAIEANDDIADVKTRLLSPSGLNKRVCLFDNIKSTRLSWDALEGLITSKSISGRELYAGEGQRPNTLTWLLTMNGASLCEDLTQRTVPIKLKRPTHSPTWTSDVCRFIESHRMEIIADIRDILQAPSLLAEASSRWGEWERQVLGKFPEWRELQALIAGRRDSLNGDDAEKDLVQAFICEQLELANFSVKEDKVLIPNGVLMDWMTRATGKKREEPQMRGFLKNLGIPNLSPGRNKHARGWKWTGDDASESSQLQTFAEPIGSKRY